MRRYLIAPSILSADFSNLGREIELAEEGGADIIHVDVMDGHFVPNITIGPIVVEAVRRVTSLPIDVHLMIENPDLFMDEFIKAGADMLSVHVEGAIHLHRSIQKIKTFGHAKAGIAINPATPIASLENILTELDFVLIMTVNPGFGGQDFIPTMLSKIELLRRWIDETGLDIKIEVDGGVKKSNIADIYGVGCDILVAGSAVFSGGDPARSIRELKAVIDN
ncbi:MAG: ribulose-phosphate 3-epimerase [Actinomycetota bacterium]|nr:ribulose-phosphate 3-epimerase [Actinomycetota bacterium]